jgi:hypothetical protein
LPAGVSVQGIDYTITRQGHTYTKSGALALTGRRSTFTAQIDEIPENVGYSIKLGATESGGGTLCTGAAMFDVVAESVTAVSVKLQCPGKRSTSGVVVNGSTNVCAVVESVTAVAASDGNSFALHGVASDPDGSAGALSYSWTTSSGTLASANAFQVTLNCPTGGGIVEVSFEVREADCGDKMSVVAECPAAAKPVVQRFERAAASLTESHISSNSLIADETPDGIFDVTIQGPVTGMALFTADSSGNPALGEQWDTVANGQMLPFASGAIYPSGTNTWFLGVEENGTLLNAEDSTLPPLANRAHQLRLYAQNSGAFLPGQYFGLVVFSGAVVARAPAIAY